VQNVFIKGFLQSITILLDAADVNQVGYCFVHPHFTTKEVTTDAMGIIIEKLPWKMLFMIQSAKKWAPH
jgi:hypothetical protein